MEAMLKNDHHKMMNFGEDHHHMMVANFKKRFYAVLLLTFPIMAIQPMI